MSAFKLPGDMPLKDAWRIARMNNMTMAVNPQENAYELMPRPVVTRAASQSVFHVEQAH